MKNTIEIKEDVRIGDVILEAGDKIRVLEDDSILNAESILKDYFLKAREIGGYQAEWFTPDLDPQLDTLLKPRPRDRDTSLYSAASLLVNKYDMDWHSIENAITQHVEKR